MLRGRHRCRARPLPERNLVDSAVATNSYADVNAIGSTLFGYVGSVTSMLCAYDLPIEAVGVDGLADDGIEFLLRTGSRYGVDNEYDLLFFCIHGCKCTHFGKKNGANKQ